MREALVAVGGVVASGKSTVARSLADALSAEALEADAIREELFGRHSARSLRPDVEHRVYEELLRRADAALAAGRPVVLDACFPRAEERDAARELAERHGAAFRFVECRADPEAVRARLEERGGAWAEVAADLDDRYEPVKGLPPGCHVVLDTAVPVAPEAIGAVARGLAREDPTPGDAPARPRAVTFDCWNTLLYEADWPLAHALRVEALVDAAAEAGRRVAREEAARAFDAAWELHIRLWQEGRATTAADVARAALAGLGLRDPHPSFEHLVGRWEEASHTSQVRALPGARETLEALARGGVRTGLVCDTGLTPGRVVRRHLDRLGLLTFLETQAFSDEVGVPKPAARIFRAALDPLGVAPEAALHVGDLRATDVAGARALGMETVRLRARYDDAGDLPDASFVVDSHRELARLLGLGA